MAHHARAALMVGAGLIAAMWPPSHPGKASTAIPTATKRIAFIAFPLPLGVGADCAGRTLAPKRSSG